MSLPKTFFDHQQDAHHRTSWALFFFLLTVLAVVLGVMGVAAIAFNYLADSSQTLEADPQTAVEKLQAVIPFGLGAFLIILFSWLIRYKQFSQGPEVVMRSMGGKRLLAESDDPDERRLMNLVEEMSIASGVPVPDVYLLDEGGINACAVGIRLDQAAVGVTRGAIQRLKRDELQGVIGHEFSHILHGDMALNTHLIAWLAGLFTISQIGSMVVRMALYSGDNGRRRRDKDDAPALPIALLGALTWLVGSIGLLFGRLLQSSVSRQREYLADASAVQYTRNPDGLANALRKLGDNGVRGRMTHFNSDCAHMMFSNIFVFRLGGLFATHPPLAKRIRNIQPGWDGTWLQTAPGPAPEASATPRPTTPGGMPVVQASLMAVMQGDARGQDQRLDAARIWKENLPTEWLAAAHDPHRAQALVYVLLLQPECRERQLEQLRQHEPAYLLEHVEALCGGTLPVNSDRLPLLEIALPALRQLDSGRRKGFLAAVEDLVAADGRVDLFEFALRSVLVGALEEAARLNQRRPRLHMREVQVEANVVLSLLARLGSDDEAEVTAAFEAARQHLLGYHGGIEFRLLEGRFCGLDALEKSLERLRDLAPAFQQRLLLAGLAAITRDGVIQSEEREAFRALAAALNIPAPPELWV